MGLHKTTISGEVCEATFMGTEYPQINKGTQLCTEGVPGRGSCMGDSGGALIELEQRCLAGLVSWGVPCARGMPDIYTRVQSYKFWIENKIMTN